MSADGFTFDPLRCRRRRIGIVLVKDLQGWRTVKLGIDVDVKAYGNHLAIDVHVLWFTVRAWWGVA